MGHLGEKEDTFQFYLSGVVVFRLGMFGSSGLSRGLSLDNVAK